MGRYLIRRILVSIVTLIAISMVVFGILAIAPGDPLSGFASNPNVPPELRERIRDVRTGPDGALWLLTDNSAGRMLRVTPAK